MNVAEGSLVGVALRLLGMSLAVLPWGFAPRQLLLASRATRQQTPWGGMPLLEKRMGVTLGSRRYRQYVDHK